MNAQTSTCPQNLEHFSLSKMSRVKGRLELFGKFIRFYEIGLPLHIFEGRAGWWTESSVPMTYVLAQYLASSPLLHLHPQHLHR